MVTSKKLVAGAWVNIAKAWRRNYDKERESLLKAKELLEECFIYFDENRVEKELKESIFAFLDEEHTRKAKEIFEDDVC